MPIFVNRGRCFACLELSSERELGLPSQPDGYNYRPRSIDSSGPSYIYKLWFRTSRHILPFWNCAQIYILVLLVINCMVSVAHDIRFDIEYPQNITAAEGKMATLKCVLYKDHEPTDQVSWITHHQNLDGETEKLRYSFSTKRISNVIHEFCLKIDPVERSDATDYKCVFSSATHTISSRKAFLNVLEVPNTLYPICYLDQPVYYVKDLVETTCVTEKTTPLPTLEFFPPTGISSLYENTSHLWISMQFAAMPNSNNTILSCIMSMNAVSDRRYCDTQALHIRSNLRVTIFGNIHYTQNKQAIFTCSGNITDSGNYTWAVDNQIVINHENQYTIALVSAEMNGIMITCTIDDAGYTGSDSIILSVEDVPMTTPETATSVPPNITIINPTLTSDDLQILKRFCIAYMILSVLIIFLLIISLYFAYNIFKVVF